MVHQRYSRLRGLWLMMLAALLLVLAACSSGSASEGRLTSTAPTGAGSSQSRAVSTAAVSEPTWNPTERSSLDVTPSATVLATQTGGGAPGSVSATRDATATGVAGTADRVELSPGPTPEATRTPKTIKETENILVLGADQRPGDLAWRTDTIMVVAIDYDASQVGIVSIPRDLWIDIPGYGMGRINQVDFQGEEQKFPGGGPALAGKVIETNLGIPTKHWVRIRQEGLVELVDALGGVTVTLNCPLHEITPHPTIANEYEHFDLPAGDVFLDGKAAKKFATFRYASNDFARAGRQQQLIWAIRDRALQIDAIPKIPELWKALSKTFKTDLSLLDVIRLARLGAKLSSEQVHGLVFSTKAIEYAVVGGGAQVLKIGDMAQLQAELSGLFSGRTISEQGREGSGDCPTPVPSPAPGASPQPTPAAG